MRLFLSFKEVEVEFLVTTVISKFSESEVSMQMLFQINEDFDDLLQ